MTEAEKLLQETKSAVVADAQTEDICVIDSNLRIASIPESFKVLGVEHDKDVRVVQFRMPKLYKNIDLSTFAISVNYQNANGIKDRYLVTDKNVSSDYIEFSWTVGSAATKYKGDTKFIVCMRLTGAEGVIEKEFNTTLATMTVLEGLEVDNPVIEQEEKDIIAQLLQIVDDKSKEAVQAVTAEGTKQIKAVQDAAKEAVKNEAEEAVRETVQESIDTITAETEKQKELIVAEGTKQIERVTEEGTKQVEIVQGAAQEIVADREQIQTNKQDIEDLRQSKADVMVHTAKGSHITVNNSADAFLEGLKIYGKSEQVQTKGYQLFDASKIVTTTIEGATITNNGDGSFAISGSGTFSALKVHGYVDYDAKVKTGEFYAKVDNLLRPEVMITKYWRQGDKDIYKTEYHIIDNTEISFDITQEDIDNNVVIGYRLCCGKGITVTPGTFKLMCWQDGDGTWEPFTGGKPSPSTDYPQEIESPGDSGKIEVGVIGKNLYSEGDMSIGDTKYTDFIPWTGKSEMFVSLRAKTNSVDGKLDVVIDYYDANKVRLGRNGWGGPCGNTFTKYSAIFTGRSAAGTGKNVDLRSVRFFKVRFGIFVDSATQIDYKDIVITDSEGVKFSGYQPPQTLSIPTPNGLPGIKVTSGGNYTDENGQQWICDELDFKRGKYVQRVGKRVFDGSESWVVSQGQDPKKIYYTNVSANKAIRVPVLCDKYIGVAKKDSLLENFETSLYQDADNKYPTYNWLYIRDDSCSSLEDFKSKLSTNNITVYYQLQTPIETDIPEETMTVYRKLYTNSPSTVIQNDAGAGMEVVYSTYSKRANKDDIFNLERTIEDKFTSIVTGSDIVADGTAQGSAIIKNIPGATKQVQTKGYQLFDSSKIPTNSEKDVTNNGDGSFTFSGGKTLTSGGVTFTIPKNLFKPGIYTFLLNGTKKQPNPYFNVIFENSKGNLYTFSADNSRFELKQEHIDSEGFTARFGYYTDGGTSTAGTWKPMFYKDGDGSWEPFTGGKPSPSAGYPQEITAVGEDKSDGYAVNITTHGNQLFDASKIQTKSAGGATVTNNGDGSFTISGSGNLTDYFGVNYQITDKKEIKKLFKTGKLYLKSSNTVPYFHIYFVDNNDSRTIELRDGEVTITEDILNNVARVVFSIYGDNKKAIVPGTVKPMVYQDGDGAWEPFKLTTSDIPLDRPLYEGDRIYLEDGELWEYRENAKVAFDGSDDEEWMDYQYNGRYRGARFGTHDMKVGNRQKFHCSHFRNIPSGEDVAGIWFGVNDSVIYILFGESGIATDANSFKTWLKSNPIEIVYQLQTPIIKKLGSAEAFNIRTFDEKTYIEVVGSDEFGTENTFIVPKSQTGGIMTDAFAAAKRNEIQLEAQQSKAHDTEQRTRNELAVMLSLMPLEIQAAMIENDTNNILNSLESEVTK